MYTIWSVVKFDRSQYAKLYNYFSLDQEERDGHWASSVLRGHSSVGGKMLGLIFCCFLVIVLIIFNSYDI